MRGVEEKAEQLLLPALERPNEKGGSRIKIPKSSEHDLTNLVKKFHSQDPRTRKWLRIDSHGHAEVVEVPATTPATQASPTCLRVEAACLCALGHQLASGCAAPRQCGPKSCHSVGLPQPCRRPRLLRLHVLLQNSYTT